MEELVAMSITMPDFKSFFLNVDVITVVSWQILYPFAVFPVRKVVEVW